MQVLMAYEFCGNVRELENIMERGVIFCRGQSLLLADLQLDANPAAAALITGEDLSEIPFREAKDRAIQHFHRQYIRRILEQYGGNISRAAEAAGIQRQYLHRLIKEVGIEATDFKSKE
jgi:DNA-binding NtrC family response regulator